MDELEKRVQIFFNDCKRYNPTDLPPSVEAEFQAIRNEYYKTLEDADEKVVKTLLTKCKSNCLILDTFSHTNVRTSRQIFT